MGRRIRRETGEGTEKGGNTRHDARWWYWRVAWCKVPTTTKQQQEQQQEQKLLPLPRWNTGGRGGARSLTHAESATTTSDAAGGGLATTPTVLLEAPPLQAPTLEGSTGGVAMSRTLYRSTSRAEPSECPIVRGNAPVTLRQTRKHAVEHRHRAPKNTTRHTHTHSLHTHTQEHRRVATYQQRRGPTSSRGRGARASCSPEGVERRVWRGGRAQKETARSVTPRQRENSVRGAEEAALEYSTASRRPIACESGPPD